MRKPHTVKSRYKDPDALIKRLKGEVDSRKRLIALYEKRYDLAATMLRKEAEA